MGAPGVRLILSVFALIGFVYLASRISQSDVGHFFRNMFAVARPALRSRRPLKRSLQRRRTITRISLEEFKRLFSQDPDNFLVLDLRTDTQSLPFPIADALVLSVTSNELKDILAWLPPNRSIVFYGARARWTSMIRTSASMEGSAPFYLLDEGISSLGVA